MTRPAVKPDQFLPGLDAMPPAERALFDAAVAAAAEKQDLRWRFRLVVMESVMMAGLVLVAGLLLDDDDPDIAQRGHGLLSERAVADLALRRVREADQSLAQSREEPMNGLFSSTPSPVAIRLAVSGLLFGQVQALILLWAPGALMGPPRSLSIFLALLSLGCMIAAIIGEPGSDPQDRGRHRRGA